MHICQEDAIQILHPPKPGHTYPLAVANFICMAPVTQMVVLYRHQDGDPSLSSEMDTSHSALDNIDFIHENRLTENQTRYTSFSVNIFKIQYTKGFYSCSPTPSHNEEKQIMEGLRPEK